MGSGESVIKFPNNTNYRSQAAPATHHHHVPLLRFVQQYYRAISPFFFFGLTASGGIGPIHSSSSFSGEISSTFRFAFESIFKTAKYTFAQPRNYFQRYNDCVKTAQFLFAVGFHSVIYFFFGGLWLWLWLILGLWLGFFFLEVSQLLWSNYNERLTDIDITRDKVLQKLQKLDPAKASGVDGISSRVLVELADEIAEPLAAIFQNSLATGEVPRSWKVADIVPIYKKGKKSVPGNYRPVSLTSQIGKLLEKIIKDEITGHLSQYHLLIDTQHGFMRGRSCLTNLLTYMEGVTRMLDEGKNVDIIYLDFAKAFDKVPHHRLIGKVASMGVEGRVKGWIQQWLEGRTQRVVINGRYSDWTAVTSGVPQGSVLGPTLFLMFINDLEDGVHSTVLKFADDTKLYTEVTKEEGGEQLQEDLDKCTEWAKQWMMEFNVSKCKVLHAGRTNRMKEYTMEGKILEKVQEEKDLGVMVDKAMNGSRQVTEAVKKANRALAQLRRTITNKEIDTVIPIYKATVRPHLEYCVQAWAPYLKKDINALEKVQHRATKMITTLRKLPYEQRLKECNLTTLEERRKRGDLLETHKIMHGLERIPEVTFFARGDTLRRGHTLKIYKERSKRE